MLPVKQKFVPLKNAIQKAVTFVFMSEQLIQKYVQLKLEELEQKKDMQHGQLSFGMSSKKFGHLPAWKDIVRRKKKMITAIWVNAFLVSLMVIGMTSEVWDKFEENWIKAIVGWIILSAFSMLFYVIWSYYSMFIQFRKTEREVRKLIYQDILQQLKKENDLQ